MAFRALRQTLPAICGAASTAAGIGWLITKSNPGSPASSTPSSDTPLPLSDTTSIHTASQYAPTRAPSPVDVCWASAPSVNESICALPFDSSATLVPPSLPNAMLAALVTLLLLALLEAAVYYAVVFAQPIERHISRHVPHSVRSVLSLAYQTYYRLAGIAEVALLALKSLGTVSTSKLPMWLHLLIVAGALLHGLWDFETDPLPDALELQAENSQLRMRIELLNKRNGRNASASVELTSALKAKSKTMLAKVEREHQKQMLATEKQHKSALGRSDISHRLRLSGLKMQLSAAREEATSKLNEAQQAIERHVTRISELEQTMMTRKKAHTTSITEAQQLIKQSIMEKMEMENTIAEANGFINELLQAQSTTQQQLKTSQELFRFVCKHGQKLFRSLALLTVQFQQRTEAAEKVYYENMFRARLESKMALEAVIRQFDHKFGQRPLMSRPVRTSTKSPASDGASPIAAWDLPAPHSFANNGFTPLPSQPSLAPSSTMQELSTGENAGEPSTAATAVDASEIDISAPVAMPQLAARDDSSESSGFAVTVSDGVTPLTSTGSDAVSPLRSASQSTQSTANPVSPATATTAGSSSVRSPPVPYRQNKDECTEYLCKRGEECVGRWSDYGPKGNYIGKNDDGQRWGSGYKPVENKLGGKGKAMELCCDCFKEVCPEIIQKEVTDFLRKEAAKTEGQKAHDLWKQVRKQAKKRERNGAKAAEKAAAAAAAAEEDK
ncbi:hypothetical protein AC579_549 [Pseudocercospora musae]|uniref:Uncharacterized protein n=1 Tax=Pseudocercospora musae TaxID=113226 RepID=A0A139IRK1_9PEZI|nr:hypothetical protein AC579_549 [Pseudocercospora musae]